MKTTEWVWERGVGEGWWNGATSGESDNGATREMTGGRQGVKMTGLKGIKGTKSKRRYDGSL